MALGGQSHGADFFAQTAAVAGGICLVAIGAAFVEKTEKDTKGAKIFAKGPFDHQRQQENCGKTQQLYSQKAGFPCLPIGKKQGGDENHQQNKEDVFELPQLSVPGEGTVLFLEREF